MSNMASIQERLQLKRVPLDKWSTKEKLCLASAVACSGDQNWMSVSRALKLLCGANRPNDWFSQKSCAAQYGKLLENVETPKRKKRTASERDGVAAVETPGESILRKLTQERVIELKKIIQEEAQQYTKVKEDIILIQSGVTDEKKLREMWKQIQAEKAQKEKEQIMHAQWLKEREEKKLELERQWRPMFPNSPNSKTQQGVGVTKVKEETDEDSQSSTKSGTSPLLTSLLKSPTANPSGSNAVVQVVGGARSAASPTITNLLTGGSSPLVMHMHGKNLFPSSGVAEAGQSFEGMQNTVQLKDVSKPDVGQSTSYQIAPKLTKLLDGKPAEIAAVDKSSVTAPATIAQESLETDEGSIKAEDMETDPDNVDPKDLMAVFQGLMPEELDDILNEDNGMILEDEMLDSVVDSIMEEEAESLKGKDLSVLEEANLADTGEVDSVDNENVIIPKNEESIPEIAKGAYLKPAAAAPSPQRTVPEEPAPVIQLPSEDMGKASSEKIDDTQDESTVQPVKEEKEDEKPVLTSDKEIIPIEDSTTNSPITNPSSVDNKEGIEPTEIVMSDSTEEDRPVAVKNEAEEDSEDKPLATLDTTHFDSKPDEIKTEDRTEIKQEDFASSSEDGKITPPVMEHKPQKEKEPVMSEEEAARAKKEAMEKLAAEYDFKDDEEPIVPLSIQKLKEEKHVTEEDIFMDAQEHLDEQEEPTKETEQKKFEDSTVTVTDTDDDSLIEMKISKTKRDYSRRRTTTDDSNKAKDDQLTLPKNDEPEGRTLRKLRDRDRSESPFVLLTDEDVKDKTNRSYSSTPVLDSVPNSPVSSEDRDYRAWKKSILSIHSKISSLRYASAFVKPLPEEQTVADVLYRPMDLTTVKKNIENGTVRTTAEYQRDIMLICTNAIMLNRTELCSPTAARVLLKECVALIEATVDVGGKQARDKEPCESRSSSASKRSSRKGTTRSSTSGARNN